MARFIRAAVCLHSPSGRPVEKLYLRSPGLKFRAMSKYTEAAETCFFLSSRIHFLYKKEFSHCQIRRRNLCLFSFVGFVDEFPSRVIRPKQRPLRDKLRPIRRNPSVFHPSTFPSVYPLPPSGQPRVPQSLRAHCLPASRDLVKFFLFLLYAGPPRLAFIHDDMDKII